MNKKENGILFIILLFSILFLTISNSNRAFAYFDAYTSESTIRLCKCEIKSYSILLENKDSYAESISITYSGTGENLVRVIPKNVFLKPGEKAHISVFMDSQCKEGQYYINFYMDAPSVKKVLKQNIVIEPCDVIELKIEKTNFTLKKGEAGELVFSITNKGTFIEEVNYRFDNLKSENFFIEPNQTIKLSLNFSGQRTGNYKKQLVVNALRTGYKKTSNIYFNVIQAQEEESALKKSIFAIGNFIKQFQKYIIIALIILFVLLVILSIGLNKPEEKIIEEEKETKKIKKKKEEKEKRFSPYYTPVITERKGLADFLRKNFRIILMVIIILLIVLLLFFALKYSWFSRFSGLFKTTTSSLFSRFSYNKKGIKEEIPEEFENNQGMFVIEEKNETVKQNVNEQNITENITEIKETNITTEELEEEEEVPEEGANQTVNQTTNQTIVEENKTENFSEEVIKEEKEGASKLLFELKSFLTSIKVFFILYLNYIIYGIVTLFIIILILNVSGFKEKRKKSSKNRKRR